MTTRSRSVRRSLIAGAGIAAVAAVTLVAPPWALGGAPTVSTVTTVNGVAGASAYTGVESTVAIRLTNDPDSTASLGYYSIIIPTGFSVNPTTDVSATGWRTGLWPCTAEMPDCATVLVVDRRNAARIAPGGSITSTIKVTPSNSAVGQKTLRIWSIGTTQNNIRDILKPQSNFAVANQPSLTVEAGASAIDLTVNTSPVVAGEATSVTVNAFRTVNGAQVPGVFTGPITFTTGSGQVTVPATAAATGLTTTTLNLVLPNVRIGETLTATSSGLTDTATFDVVRGGADYTGVRGVSRVLTLNGPGGTTFTADLVNGFIGELEFTEVPCDAINPDLICDTEVNLNGVFKDELGNLYSNDNPAKLIWTCPVSECPYVEPGNSYGDNLQEQWVDFDNYKVEVSLKLDDGSYTPFEVAGFCNAQSSDPSLGVSGRITWPGSQAPTALNPTGKGFCVDVYGITRDGSSFTGDLSIPVLFVEDPKLRGI